MDKIQWSELRSSSYRHNVFIARGYTMINVIDMAKKWNSRYFICAPSGEDVIGYVEWNDALKVATINNKAPFEWYVREGTNQDVQEVISDISGYYEEGEISKRGRKPGPSNVKPGLTTDSDIKHEITTNSLNKTIIEVIKEELPGMCRVRELEKENESLRNRVKELERGEKSLIDINELEKENESLRNRVKELERGEKSLAAIKKFEKENESLRNRVKELDEKNIEFLNGWEKAKIDCKEYEKVIEESKRVIEGIRNECNETIDRLDQEKQYLNDLVETQAKKIKQLQDEIDGRGEPRPVGPVVELNNLGQEGEDGQVGIYKGRYHCYQMFSGWVLCDDKPPSSKRQYWYSKDGVKEWRRGEDGNMEWLPRL